MAAVNLLRDRQMSSETAVDAELESVLQLLDAVVSLLPCYVVRFDRDRIRPACVFLSDASQSTGHTWLGYLFMCPIRGGVWAHVWAGIPTPPWLLRLFASHRVRETEIGQLEAAVAAACYFSLPSEWVAGRPISHYVDNQGALYSLIFTLPG